MNLFEVFVNKHGTTAKALAYINQSLGTSYIHSKYKCWVQGEKLPHYKTFYFIHSEVLEYVIENAGLENAHQEMLSMQLRLPNPNIKKKASK